MESLDDSVIQVSPERFATGPIRVRGAKVRPTSILGTIFDLESRRTPQAPVDEPEVVRPIIPDNIQELTFLGVKGIITQLILCPEHDHMEEARTLKSVCDVARNAGLSEDEIYQFALDFVVTFDEAIHQRALYARQLIQNEAASQDTLYS